MPRLQHFGYFFGRGFGPQAWGRPAYDWGYDWTRPQLYQQSIRELEQAGLDLLIMEDALSLGSEQTLDVRVRSAYGGPKHDPLLLAPYLFDVTQHIGIAPTINTGATPPYLAARQAATLQHLSNSRFGLNVVTDVGSARHFGAPPLPHDAAYDRADEWMRVVRQLWNSWGEGALVADTESGHFADASRIEVTHHSGTYFDGVTGPLNALPFGDGDPVVVSPGGSPRGLAFAGANSQVQLALAHLTVDSIRAYRQRVLEAAAAAGRSGADIKTLFVIKPEIVSSVEEAERVVAASTHPSDAELDFILLGQSSDAETDLTGLDLDKPLDPSVFGEHVSQGTIAGLRGGFDSFADVTLRELVIAKARKRRVGDGDGMVGTVDEIADLFEALGDDAGNDGFIFSGDLHPTSIHRVLDELVPTLRRRGLLRREYGDGGLRGNLLDF
ncbi:MAG TPA: LLM class flavin-dependent oxidoreductase [Pseudolysinimonas sp.]|nr:LLM class flavin-dependent oxidoreductase [Pseudolysinimonas sp.]